MIQTTLQTQRLNIRPLNERDARFMYELLNSEGWLKYIGDRNIHSEEAAAAYIQKILSTPDFYYSVIEIADSQTSIGILSFIYRQNYEYPDFGYALLPDFHKRGYAKEASEAYLDALKKDGSLSSILAITKQDNFSSIDLLIKLGFKYLSTDQERADKQFIRTFRLPGN